MKGLTAWIYKSDGKDCSNGGLSSKAEKVTLIPSHDFPCIPELFEASEEAPAVAIVERNCGGPYLTAYPVNADGDIDSAGRMAGGCFISACDSRFPANYPVPLHDRKEC